MKSTQFVHGKNGQCCAYTKKEKEGKPWHWGARVEAISKIGFWVNPPKADKNRGGGVFQTGGIR